MPLAYRFPMSFKTITNIKWHNTVANSMDYFLYKNNACYNMIPLNWISARDRSIHYLNMIK